MDELHATDRTHESLDHEHPTSAGLMSDDREPGTDIFGDETVVRPAAGVDVPGLAPDDPPHRPGEAHHGRTSQG